VGTGSRDSAATGWSLLWATWPSLAWAWTTVTAAMANRHRHRAAVTTPIALAAVLLGWLLAVNSKGKGQAT
jgi:hypothetical protein